MKYSEQVLTESGVPTLQYGDYAGYSELKTAWKKFLNKKYKLVKEDDGVNIEALEEAILRRHILWLMR